MTTLFVNQNTDFRGGAAETNIDDIVFDASAQAAADFEPGQFGAGLISNDVVIHGDEQVNIIRVTFSGTASFSAAGWDFQDWTAGSDSLTIFGSTGSDNITGSSQNDTIEGNGGLDHIDAGGGNDRIRIDVVLTAGTTFDGGTQFAGGIDTMTFTAVTIDLRPADIIGMEQLEFISSGQTAIVDGDQVGGLGFSQVSAEPARRQRWSCATTAST